jgi:hypothetical protein
MRRMRFLIVVQALALVGGLTLLGCRNEVVMRAEDLGVSDDLAADQGMPADLASGADIAVPLDLETGLGGCNFMPDGGVADELRCAGLYSNWATRTVDPANRPYAPGFELWSDGAIKSRWINLPAGQKIDVSDLNEWTFPVGTKLWKEFALNINGTVKKVETRLMVKLAAGSWVLTTYVWDDGQTSATRLTTGMKPWPGTAGLTVPGSSTTGYTGYEIPSSGQCTQCHNGRKDKVLGMEAILMAAPTATGLTWTMLQSEGLLTSTNTNKDVPATALQIPGTAKERDALGALQANCGVCCHNKNAMPAAGQLQLRMDIDNVTQTAPTTVAATLAYARGVNVLSSFTPTGGTGNYYRFRPTDSSRSTIYYRPGQRESAAQMPPIDSHAVSDSLEAAIKGWIDYMTTANGYPTPLPP